MWWNPGITYILLALLLDLLVGDPRWTPHPVVGIGKAVTRLEKKLYRGNLPPRRLYRQGLVLVGSVLALTLLSTLAVLYFSYLVHPFLNRALYTWFLASTLAVRGLGEAGLGIYRSLDKGNLGEARRKAGEIVGRDTGGLEEKEVVRAAVETVAENTVDGVTAPLFYALLGGLPLALLYKAVNTLDSMVGYRDERYIYFGRASARLDDLANYIPARLTALAMLPAAALLRFNWKRGWETMMGDARRHPSPNSGLAEALVAGALGVQLGGVNYYRGVPSRRAPMGRKTRELQRGDIQAAVSLMQLTTFLFLAAGCLTWLMLN